MSTPGKAEIVNEAPLFEMPAVCYNRAMIDQETQIKMFDEYGTPPHVRRHCDAVTLAALRIGRALNAAGFGLDLELIEGAARIHDVARTAERHADAGAVFLIERGYPAEAELVRGHMSHFFGKPEEADELDVLCLADRVVKEDRYVGIDERMAYLLAKPGVTPDLAEKIVRAMEFTKGYIAEIEKIIGVSFDDLLGQDE